MKTIIVTGTPGTGKTTLAKKLSEIMKFAYIDANKVIATSRSDAGYIASLHGYSKKRVFVLTPGVNLELFKPMNRENVRRMLGIDNKCRMILFVGRIEPLKGIDVLLYALKILMDKNPKINICLYIVGRQSKESGRLRQVLKLLNISKNVNFAGKKNQSELPFYYNASEIAILPSQYESFGIAALEAMACGVPVITTDVTGIATLFDESHHPLVTSAGNPVLLAKKIEHLLDNKKEYQRLSTEVLKKAKSLSWEQVADKFSSMTID